MKERERHIGLARALSKRGHCSRAQGFVLVRAGRVRINGRVCRDPETPTGPSDAISVDGATVSEVPRVYLMMNKPRGVVTTTRDEKGRDTVFAHLPMKLPIVSPVGRLDKASEGLLLFTNDNEWAARISGPESHVRKTYHVHIDRIADDALLAKLREGVAIGGERLRVGGVEILRQGKKNS